MIGLILPLNTSHFDLTNNVVIEVKLVVLILFFSEMIKGCQKASSEATFSVTQFNYCPFLKSVQIFRQYC